MKHPIAIVGGGLAGLVAARRLHQAGHGFALFEARDRLGGRILSADAPGAPSADGFDLGPSWVWPALQPGVGSLIEELALPTFPQNSAGDMIFERPGEKPMRFPGVAQQPPSIRIAGGTGALVTAIAAGLPAASLHLNARVRRMDMKPHGVVLSVGGGEFTASHAILALPPRLLEATISFAPPIAPATASLWRNTPTWMAPHAKFFAIYGRAFWRNSGLSGDAQSMVGPLVEIHDATTASGTPALFGFLGAPAERRARFPQQRIVGACVDQLVHLFGPEAANPRATLYKDWASDPLTSTGDDQIAASHPAPGAQPWITGEWARHITLAGSETSETFPGYLAGALDSARRATAAALAR